MTQAKTELQSGDGEATGKWWRVVLLGAILAAIVLRVLGCGTEFWLDEIWSLRLTRAVPFWTEIWTGLHHDNNHYLMTLWLWILGDGREWWAYRAPSVVAGMGAMLLAVMIGDRQSRVTGVWAGVLVGLSYVMIVYSSEARGYALACCLALAAYACLDRYLKEPKADWMAGYWAAGILGPMAHLTFASVALALAAWAGAELFCRQRRGVALRRFVALHVVPVAVWVGLWWIDLRHLRMGGGPEVGMGSILGETLCDAFGVPLLGWAGAVLGVLVAAFVVREVVAMARRGDLRWVFFSVALFMGPAALLLASGRAFLYPRYFLVNLTFLYVLIALRCGSLWEMKRWRGVLAGGLALWCAGNLWQSYVLLRDGRGHTLAALEFMAEVDGGSWARVGSNFDLRHSLLTEYYLKYLPEDGHLRMMRQGDVGLSRPEWLLVHRSPYEAEALQAEIVVSPYLRYELVQRFPTVRISGIEEGVYRRADLMRGDGVGMGTR